MPDPDLQPAPRPRLRKHLIDPNYPRPASTRRDMSLTHVQMWVMSILVTTTIMHTSAGLVVGAFFLDRLSAQIGLLVIGGCFGVVAVAAGLAIHRHRLLTWWLLLGWLPPLVGAYLLFVA